MSAETPNPQPGDRVRVTYVGMYEPTPHGPLLVSGGSPKRSIFEDAIIEVLERALCPEIEGATGIRCQQPTGHVGGHKGTTTEEQTKAVGYPLFVSWPAESEPPARRLVRVPNEPHGPSADAVAYMARLIKAGKPVEAVGVAHDQGMEWVDARRYVESMPEYETYLNHHAEKAEPRVFMSYGPEPPADVRVLEWLDATDGRRYLKRFESAWLWVDGPNDRDPGGVGEWPPFHPGRYREVS